MYDQLSRTGNGVPLLVDPEWPSIAELVPAWAKELADATTSVHELEDELWYHLQQDVINGFLNDPLRGSRLGLGAFDPAGHARYEGRWLFRRMGEDISVCKEAVLEIALRHRLPPPSWWFETQELKLASPQMIRWAIKRAYDTAEHEGRKPPNIKELPAAVRPFLEERGLSASGRSIQRHGEAEEFKRRRRRPGKTLASERRK
jgi:hypothetical protein